MRIIPRYKHVLFANYVCKQNVCNDNIHLSNSGQADPKVPMAKLQALQCELSVINGLTAVVYKLLHS